MTCARRDARRVPTCQLSSRRLSKKLSKWRGWPVSKSGTFSARTMLGIVLISCWAGCVRDSPGKGLLKSRARPRGGGNSHGPTDKHSIPLSIVRIPASCDPLLVRKAEFPTTSLKYLQLPAYFRTEGDKAYPGRKRHHPHLDRETDRGSRPAARRIHPPKKS